MFNTQQLDNNDQKSIRPLPSPVMIRSEVDSYCAVLRCHVVHDFHHSVVIPLRHVSTDIFVLDTSTGVSLISTESLPASVSTKEIYIINSRISTISTSNWRPHGFLVRTLSEGFHIQQCFSEEAWNSKDKILQGKRDTSGSRSWSASLQLSFNLATNDELTVEYMIFLKLGINHSSMEGEQPRAWYHVNDMILPSGAASLEKFHNSMGAPRHEVQRFRPGNVTRLDLVSKPHSFLRGYCYRTCLL
jgi:hypothetical protein